MQTQILSFTHLVSKFKKSYGILQRHVTQFTVYRKKHFEEETTETAVLFQEQMRKLTPILHLNPARGRKNATMNENRN